MNRVRLIVKDIHIQYQGEVNFFTIKLPNNIKRIIGVENDAFIRSAYSEPVFPSNPDGTVDNPLVVKWAAQNALSLGKVKLQSLDRTGIFYEAWVSHLFYGKGVPDMSFGRIPVGSLTIDRKNRPKPMNLRCKHFFVEGMFEDSLGTQLNHNMDYHIRIFVWVETTEPAKGIAFEFEDKDFEGEPNLLQIKI
ncbi:MAG: hypothetical protein IT236_09315 [Bacteroidia bacterium]|nr:hypothetical protein [Bacteroidia bacterium]